MAPKQPSSYFLRLDTLDRTDSQARFPYPREVWSPSGKLHYLFLVFWLTNFSAYRLQYLPSLLSLSTSSYPCKRSFAIQEDGGLALPTGELTPESVSL